MTLSPDRILMNAPFLPFLPFLLFLFFLSLPRRLCKVSRNAMPGGDVRIIIIKGSLRNFPWAELVSSHRDPEAPHSRRAVFTQT